MKILVIATSGIGDTLCLAPLLQRLRGGFSGSRMDLVTTQAQALPFLRPWVDGPILLDPRWMSGTGRLARSLWTARAALARSGPYDLALVSFPSGHWTTALLANCSGAPRRLGFAYPEGGRNRSAWGLTEAVAPRAEHVIDRNLELALAAGPPGAGAGEDPAGLSLHLPEGPVEFSLEEGPEPFVALHLGGGFKRWPFDSFHALARSLMDERRVRICLVGGEAERHDSERMHDRLGPRAVNLAARLTLPQTAHALKRCRLLVSSDTGLVHLAAGLGVPVAAVFGPTSDRRYAPRGAHGSTIVHSLPCRPCYVGPARRAFSCAFERKLACLAELDVRAVFDASCRLLDRAPAAAP